MATKKNNKKRLAIVDGSRFNASVKFTEGLDGNMEERIVLHSKENTGYQKRPIYATSHGKVTLTSKGLVVSFLVNRHKNNAHQIADILYSECDDVINFINTQDYERRVAKEDKAGWAVSDRGS